MLKHLPRLLLLIAGPCAECAVAPDRIVSTEIVGTKIQVRLQSGRVLNTEDLVGAVLDLDLAGVGTRSVRIDGVRRDPRDGSGEVLLYSLSLKDEPTGSWTAACDADPDGRTEALPLQGSWDKTGHRISERGLTLACTSGAIAKCVRFGYRPWNSLDDGTPLSRYHEACIHMVRADYCGDGSATTRDGTLIDVFDDAGIETPDPAQTLPFEAAWDEHGAVCVAHTRIRENVSLAQLARACPRLATRLGGKACTAERARSMGKPLVFNGSR